MKNQQTEIPHIHLKEQPHLVKEGVFVVTGEVWSTQKRIAKIYGRSIPTISDHLKKIYREKELLRSESERVLFITQKEGKKEVTRKIYVYNADTVIAIGFRVKGDWGREFRIWAREIVRASFDPRDQIAHLIVKPKHTVKV